MADNYLESRMEAYHSGKLGSARSATRRPSGSLVPGLHLVFPSSLVLVLADETPDAVPFLQVFRSAGLNVCFSCTRGGVGAVKAAQQYGVRHYPDGMASEKILDDICRTYKKKVDNIVDLRGEPMNGAIVLSAAAKCTDQHQCARMLLFLLHPDNEPLFGNQSLFSVRKNIF